ncbi:MAG: SLC13 family permease [Pirellulaceae bacterium]
MEDAMAGLGNPGLVTIGILYVVVAGLSHTGAMSLVSEPFLGRPKTPSIALARLTPPVLLLSAFLNNTPVVAMFLPIVSDVCKRTGISPSKLYLPIAYLATFGGVCTLVGTSTNLIVNSLLVSTGDSGMGMFDLSWVGLPCAFLGAVYLQVAVRRFIPDRQPSVSIHDDPRRYTVEMVVQPVGPLVGKSIEDAGLRHLVGLYLADVERDGEFLGSVGHTHVLRANDVLVFVGVVESMVELQRIRGLSHPAECADSKKATSHGRCLVEAVVSERCPLVGCSIRDGQFRTKYGAAVVAVARGSHRIEGKIGDVVLQRGDTLILETTADFVVRERNSNHFYLVAGIDNSSPVQYQRAKYALTGLVAMLVFVSCGWLQLLTASFVAAGWMIATGCCSISQARQSVDWSLLVTVAASLGIGNALEQSGLGKMIADSILVFAGTKPWLALVAVYVVTMILTELITNNAAAVLVFSVAQALADTLHISLVPFAVAIAVAASAGFATPFGYQTNLMVFAIGGYRFSDYLRIGIPLDLIFLVVSVTLIPVFWPLR